MNKCCDNGAAFDTPLTPVKKMPMWLDEFVKAFTGMSESNSLQVAFAALTPAEQQALLDMIVKELWRHVDDVRRGWDEVQKAVEQHPYLQVRNVFIATWVEVK